MTKFEYDGFEFCTQFLNSTLFVAVSGAHAYGWRTPTSDLDIRKVWFPAKNCA